MMTYQFTDDPEQKPEWKMIRDASFELHVSPQKLSRLSLQGKIKSRINPRDERQKFVDMVELRKMFPVEE